MTTEYNTAAANGTQPSTVPHRSCRRAEPSKRVAKNGTVAHEFRAEVGIKPDGGRDRLRFTCRTLAEARKQLRRITTEVTAGIYVKSSTMTVNQACDQWLDGRRGIRRITLDGYRNDLKPARRFLGGKELQQLTKADGGALVEWMLTQGRRSAPHYQPGSLAARVAAMIGAHPGGVTAGELAAAFPGEDVHTCLSGLLHGGRVTRPRRALYALADTAVEVNRGGLSLVSVRAALTRLTSVMQSFVNQRALPHNVIALVEHPRQAHREVVDPGRSADLPRGGAGSPTVRVLATEHVRAAPL